MVIGSYGRGPSNETAWGGIRTSTEGRQDMSVFDPLSRLGTAIETALEAIGSSTLIALAAVIVIVGLLELRAQFRMREQCGS